MQRVPYGFLDGRKNRRRKMRPNGLRREGRETCGKSATSISVCCLWLIQGQSFSVPPPWWCAWLSGLVLSRALRVLKQVNTRFSWNCSGAVMWFLTVMMTPGYAGGFEITGDHRAGELWASRAGETVVQRWPPGLMCDSMIQTKCMISYFLPFRSLSLYWRPQLPQWTMKQDDNHEGRGGGERLVLFS